MLVCYQKNIFDGIGFYLWYPVMGVVKEPLIHFVTISRTEEPINDHLRVVLEAVSSLCTNIETV